MKVSSSHIAEIIRRPRTNAIDVIFVNGARYRYGNVSYEEYLTLIHSKSVGEAFWATIRDQKPVLESTYIKKGK